MLTKVNEGLQLLGTIMDGNAYLYYAKRFNQPRLNFNEGDMALLASLEQHIENHPNCIFREDSILRDALQKTACMYPHAVIKESFWAALEPDFEDFESKLDMEKTTDVFEIERAMMLYAYGTLLARIWLVETKSYQQDKETKLKSASLLTAIARLAQKRKQANRNGKYAHLDASFWEESGMPSEKLDFSFMKNSTATVEQIVRRFTENVVLIFENPPCLQTYAPEYRPWAINLLCAKESSVKPFPHRKDRISLTNLLKNKYLSPPLEVAVRLTLGLSIMWKKDVYAADLEGFFVANPMSPTQTASVLLAEEGNRQAAQSSEPFTRPTFAETFLRAAQSMSTRGEMFHAQTQAQKPSVGEKRVSETEHDAFVCPYCNGSNIDVVAPVLIGAHLVNGKLVVDPHALNEECLNKELEKMKPEELEGFCYDCREPFLVDRDEQGRFYIPVLHDNDARS